MLWFYAEEERYYRDPQQAIDYARKRKTLPKEYEAAKNIVWLYDPDRNEIARALRECANDEKIAVIAPRYPSDTGYKDFGLFVLVELPNDHGVMTSELKEVADEDLVLTANLGLKVTRPSVSFEDMAGAQKLMDDARFMVDLEMLDRAIGGIFLFGVPGTGKSYFAECFAGETDRHLVEMDLPFIINSDNPTRLMDKIFDFLYRNDRMKFVLWIDEIEKMYDMQNLKAKQVFGKLLTKLNEVAKEEMKHIIFVATANKIVDIMKNNPEFLRKGRFRKLYFLNFPKREDALDMLSFYIERANRKFKKQLLRTLYKASIDKNLYEAIRSKTDRGAIFKDLARLVTSKEVRDWVVSCRRNGVKQSNSHFEEVVSKYRITADVSHLYGIIDSYYHRKEVKNRFIYTPSEIKVFIEELSDYLRIHGNERLEEGAKNTLDEIIPIQISMKSAILEMVSQAKEVDEMSSKQFIEV